MRIQINNENQVGYYRGGITVGEDYTLSFSMRDLLTSGGELAGSMVALSGLGNRKLRIQLRFLPEKHTFALFQFRYVEELPEWWRDSEIVWEADADNLADPRWFKESY